MKTVVSERGQIVIPKAIRDRMGLRPGQELECREERGAFIAVKASRSDPVAAVYGILNTPHSSDGWLETLRGKPR